METSGTNRQTSSGVLIVTIVHKLKVKTNCSKQKNILCRKLLLWKFYWMATLKDSLAFVQNSHNFCTYIFETLVRNVITSKWCCYGNVYKRKCIDSCWSLKKKTNNNEVTHFLAEISWNGCYVKATFVFVWFSTLSSKLLCNDMGGGKGKKDVFAKRTTNF